MESMKIKSISSSDTMKIAKRLASILSKGDLIVLSGELRSGKNKIH